MRILITPNVANPYDQRMVSGLAEGFNSIGHSAKAMSTPLSSAVLAQMCDEFSIDVLLQINRTRDQQVPFSPRLRHISWFQDVFPETLDGFSESFRSTDILYALGDPKVLGLNKSMPCYVGSLFTGVDQSIFDFNTSNLAKDLDFSLCGGLPPPFDLAVNYNAVALKMLDVLIKKVPLLQDWHIFWILRKLLFNRQIPVNCISYATLAAMALTVQSKYKPLRGELDIHSLADAIIESVDCHSYELQESAQNLNLPESPYSKFFKRQSSKYIGRSDLKARLFRYLAGESSFIQRSKLSPAKKALSYFSQSYPRILDRQALVESALAVSDSLELYGPGLSAHDFARPFFKNVIETQDELLKVYSRSKINLSNNTHGLGLHSRTLECMAIGGFIFMHESPNDNKPGGMLTSFEPGVHYASYTPENFQQEAIRWLTDDDDRAKVGLRAQSVIRDRHTWRHRAQQIVEDLSR